MPAVIILSPGVCKGLGAPGVVHQPLFPNHTACERGKRGPAGLSRTDAKSHTLRPSVAASLGTWAPRSPLLPPHRPHPGLSGDIFSPTGLQRWRAGVPDCSRDRPQSRPGSHSGNYPTHSFSLSHVSSGELTTTSNSKKASNSPV